MHLGMGRESLPGVPELMADGGWAAKPTFGAQTFETGGPRPAII